MFKQVMSGRAVSKDPVGTPDSPVVVVAADPYYAQNVADEVAHRLGIPTGNASTLTDFSAAGPSSIAASAGDLADVALRRRVRRSAHVAWVRSARHGNQREEAESLAVLSTAADAIIEFDPSDDGGVSESVDGVLRSLADKPGALSPLVDEQQMVFGDGRRTDIVVGHGVIDRLKDFVHSGCRKVAIVTQAGIDVTVDCGVEQRVFEVPPGESAKRLDVVGDLASRFAQWGMTRADMVVAVGGGVVTDLGGFAAASYHRGIPVVHVATTLLGQIDAAIGGKCGVNLPEGKNLVGAFWQPRAVLCEIEALDTLPTREFTAGMGELAKYHFLGGGHLDRLTLTPRVARSAAIKADVVTGDEREVGRRAILNYGHTLAHALETAGHYDLRHGEAVGIGLIYAAELAHRLGRINAERVAEHRKVVRGYGLSTEIPDGYDLDLLVDLFARDKKALTGITFVLDGPNGVETVPVDDNTALRETLDAVI